MQENKLLLQQMVSTHSRPKAAGSFAAFKASKEKVSTHSRPKAAGARAWRIWRASMRFQHTAARRRLGKKPCGQELPAGFQHTAARRRLVTMMENIFAYAAVSTHSRPKAAGMELISCWCKIRFQHTAARRRLEPLSKALLHQVSQPRFR